MREFFPFTTLINSSRYPRSNGLQSGTITKKTEMQCNSAMPDFIIAGEKVIIRKSPNHIQNTLLIGDSTSLLVIK
jgi:hypothetical protein